MHELRPSVNGHDWQTGNPDARTTLVEFGDYQCPYCGMVYPFVKQLLKNEGHDIRFVFRHFPLQSTHADAMCAALASEAAGQQKQFWAMHDLLFENQNYLGIPLYISLAEKLKLNMSKFQLDINGATAFEKINDDFKSGAHSGVNGTPSFFINSVRVVLPDISYESLLHAVEGKLH